MSKPNFRLDVSAEQAQLLHELLSKCAVAPQKAQSMAGLWGQVIKAMKHHGISDPPQTTGEPQPGRGSP